jgi:hypothetical protein
VLLERLVPYLDLRSNVRLRGVAKWVAQTLDAFGPVSMELSKSCSLDPASPCGRILRRWGGFLSQLTLFRTPLAERTVLPGLLLIAHNLKRLHITDPDAGSWDDEADILRSGARKPSDASWKMRDPQLPKSKWYLTDAQFLGFRIVRPLKVPSKEEMERCWTSFPLPKP